MLSTLCWGGLLMGALVGNAQAAGPLRVCEANPRYFADASGRAILLVGAHTWNNLQDIGESDPPPAFDWEAYLDFLTRHHHNFVRMWRWELTIWDTRPSQGNRHHFCAPHPWARTGPGLALDGKPKFDLTRYDETYFSRLRSRVESAGKRGIYVSIMLFEGWGLQFGENAWQAHPFNPQNNVNGIGSDPNGDGKGLEVHELVDPQMTAVQEAYVRKVIDTVNDLDNVLYEISNENHPASTEWQYHMIRFIHDYERRKPKQHPVGMTFQYKGGSNQTLFDSPAEWISPNPEGGYRDDPPAADGNKVVINDTDHLWGIGGNRQWVWKSFCRGLNPIFMDPYEGVVLPSDAKWESIRASLGHVLALSERLDLAKLTPQNTLASTGYCLAEPGREYVVYLPEGGEVKVDLSQAQGSLAVEWISGASGEVSVGPAIAGGSLRSLTCPLAGDAVLHLHRLDEAAPLQTREALQLLPSAPIPREFRLRVSENHRYLVDQDGRPWLWIGDTGWSLFHSLTAEEAEMYLENRRQKGFTLIQCILAHYWGSVPAHGIAETESPWLDNNPATPNPTFFEHVDRVLQIAQQKGLVLGLLPAWGDLVVSRKVLTTANARAYGKWLGTRYKDSPNIVWILGGDQPPTGFEDVYRELAAGLREGDGGRHLITYHPRGGQQSSTYFHEEPWLDLNMMQSGHVIDIPNYAMVLADYARTPVKPTLDGEPRYEHIINGLREEGPRISAHQVRKAAYNALLSGACGHTYGCSEIYRFWRPGDEGRWGPDTPWQAAMDFPGAFHIGYLKALLLSLPWHTLHPEPSLIAGQPGSGGTYMPAALSADRSRALIYVPETQVVPVNLARLSARKVRATWYNPRDGSFIPVGEFSGDSTPRFVAPAPDPDADYVLLLEATVPDTEPPTVQRVINVGNLTTLVIRFSEPVSPESAADLRNYRINDHINLTEATLGGDNQTVILRTSKMEEGKLYTLRVRRIEDQATKPNRMTKEIAVQFRAEPRITLPGGLQAQYLFGETSGTMIHDSAGTDDPLELAIIDAEAVEWLKPGLAVRRSTLIVAERTSRLVEACREANALTIEAWIKPANINQAGPARIVSLSKDTGARNFTLGQTESSYIARLRTTTTSTNGMPETITPLGTVVPELTHVVFVREPSGTTMLYINGVSQAVGYAGGDLSNWEEDYQLTLANEVTQDRPWLGEFRVVRLYSRPLTMDEVLALYLAGPISIVP